MHRMRGFLPYPRISMAAVALALGAGIALAPMASVMAQSQPSPGATINGTVPTSEGNVWNGLDHQPTPADVPPITNPQTADKINGELNKLDQKLMNDKLPKVPAGAPPVVGN